ncbi:hypothetical protein [Xanthomonas arboricola]|uniref:Uncharacterized protein n=1 Tax=Xanthomonas campestris pv. juglandis TaxID=195709 RepID=A0A7U7DDK3_XANCJ|nr:hypothetical protein [Xanthomonas arboricola]CAD1792744.1 hypothetical protein XSP_002350 [Xanthomonas arboricola pv. juglandis]CAD2256909.1 hypothetical protein X12_001826 [Xanthomonas arboricola]CAD7349133.1 hypothetical protein X12_002058 [Xanthomonas arboricola]SUZ38344.1 hypothetical protein CPBF1521_42960 [Xanthomonas arboricola pv. juglandis]SYZ61467.1 hypothetical protein CPBF427_36540 [Xanthomonas arboricola pv. juglandis]
MIKSHPNDKLAALQWAVERARQAAAGDELVRLNVLPALQQLRDEARREARR